MAASYIYFNDQTQFGRMLRALLRTLEAGDDQFEDVRDVMLQMRDGDGTQDAHYTDIRNKFGFDTDAKARAAFEELDSAYAKTSGNASVTNVRAARDQLFARLRGY